LKEGAKERDKEGEEEEDDGDGDHRFQADKQHYDVHPPSTRVTKEEEEGKERRKMSLG